MQLKRSILSFFLLLSYLLGLGHQIVPHMHDENHDHVENHHHHHSKDSNSINHEHVKHGSHYDDNFYDLLVCFLGEMEHGTSSCHESQTFLLKRNFNSIKEASISPFQKIVFNRFHLINNRNLSCYFEVSNFTCLIESRSLRGPPITPLA